MVSDDQQPQRLTAARLALREAARAVAARAAAPPAEAEPGPDDPPRRRKARSARPGPRRRKRSRLLQLDEVYVGSPGLGEPFAYRDADGKVVATVEVLHAEEGSKVEALLSGDSRRHADERWVVVEKDDVLFYVERYRPVDHPSYSVFDADGTSLGTYVSEGGLLHRKVLVREASSAPVARIRVEHHRHLITQAGGEEIAWCWRAFSGFGNDDDDEVWGLRVEHSAELLDRRALVAAPLLCHLMGFPKRHIDPDSEIAMALVITVPPVGLTMAAVERAVDGLYWLRRRLE